jgi:hypothetical protein
VVAFGLTAAFGAAFFAVAISNYLFIDPAQMLCRPRIVAIFLIAPIFAQWGQPLRVTNVM